MRAGGISEPSRKRQPKSSPKSAKKKERQSADKDSPSQGTGAAQGQDELDPNQSDAKRKSLSEQGSQESISDGVRDAESIDEKVKDTESDACQENTEETGAPDQRQGESQSTLEVPGEEETNEDQEMSDDPQERQVISVMTEQSIDESEVKVLSFLTNHLKQGKFLRYSSGRLSDIHLSGLFGCLKQPIFRCPKNVAKWQRIPNVYNFGERCVGLVNKKQ